VIVGSTIPALLSIAVVLISAGCLAQAPDAGAWRKVSDSRLERQFHFSGLLLCRSGRRLLGCLSCGNRNGHLLLVGGKCGDK